MKIIGITGGIGTGKSTILHLLQEKYGAYIIETDRLAHTLMEPGQSVYSQIISCFGDGILSDNQTIDRNKLGAIVFSNPEKLQMLNEIVHPGVKRYILDDISKKRTLQDITLYVIEAALLIEDGYKVICDELWYIYTKEDVRIKRLMANRGGKKEKWEAVIANQSKEAYYLENCDYVIENNDCFEKTKEIIEELLYKQGESGMISNDR